MKTGLAKLNAGLITKLEDPGRTMTLFLPTDDAFAKIPIDVQMKIDQNLTYLEKVAVFLCNFVVYTLCIEC